MSFLIQHIWFRSLVRKDTQAELELRTTGQLFVHRLCFCVQCYLSCHMLSALMCEIQQSCEVHTHTHTHTHTQPPCWCSIFNICRNMHVIIMTWELKLCLLVCCEIVRDHVFMNMPKVCICDNHYHYIIWKWDYMHRLNSPVIDSIGVDTNTNRAFIVVLYI